MNPSLTPQSCVVFGTIHCVTVSITSYFENPKMYDTPTAFGRLSSVLIVYQRCWWHDNLRSSNVHLDICQSVFHRLWSMGCLPLRLYDIYSTLCPCLDVFFYSNRHKYLLNTTIKCKCYLLCIFSCCMQLLLSSSLHFCMQLLLLWNLSYLGFAFHQRSNRWCHPILFLLYSHPPIWCQCIPAEQRWIISWQCQSTLITYASIHVITIHFLPQILAHLVLPSRTHLALQRTSPLQDLPYCNL